MTDLMSAVVVDDAAAGRLCIAEVPRPPQRHGELLVRVAAVSLNRGEVKTARAARAGFRPGWDFAGLVVEPSADGAGPAAGARVVGLTPLGAWSQFVAATPHAVAEIPDNVDFAAAAALPVAGLTARAALARGTPSPGRSILVTGASGGVGSLAVQLAALQKANVTAAVRRPEHEAFMRKLGANNVAVGEDLEDAAAFAPYDLILESVGGNALSRALTLLSRGGTCVLYGASASSITTFDASQFRVGGTSLYGLVMQYEIARASPSDPLAELLALVSDQKLKPIVELCVPLADIARAADDLMERRFVGKAVIMVDGSLK